jgi:isocitrate lyase
MVECDGLHHYADLVWAEFGSAHVDDLKRLFRVTVLCDVRCSHTSQ